MCDFKKWYDSLFGNIIILLLSWSMPDGGSEPLLYRIYECPIGGGVCEAIAEVPAEQITCPITTSDDEAHCYIVTALDKNDDESLPSNETFWYPSEMKTNLKNRLHKNLFGL